ncbi:MAG: Holliday junction resolvase RuvX [Patescibacteria group bacterium]
MTRILGIDFGTKRLGLAFGDSATSVAAPLETI